MPKKISIVKKRQWLRAYEEGKPEASIASQNRCDVRTIKKGIEEARRERDASLARADLLKEALRNHNESLLKIIFEILPALIPMPSNQPIPWKEKPISGLVAIPGGEARYENWPEPRVLSITLDVEARTEWEPLQEHIKRDRLGEALSQWKKGLVSHLEARMAAKEKLATLLQAKTGYEMADKTVDTPSLAPYSVDVLFQPVLEWLLGIAGTSNIEHNINLDLNRGEVNYADGPTLAYVPRKEEECRKNIIHGLNLLQDSDEAKSVLDTFKTAQRLTTKARQAAEEICMLGLLPGQCRICRRLGM